MSLRGSNTEWEMARLATDVREHGYHNETVFDFLVFIHFTIC